MQQFALTLQTSLDCITLTIQHLHDHPRYLPIQLGIMVVQSSQSTHSIGASIALLAFFTGIRFNKAGKLLNMVYAVQSRRAI